jgi:hypothetical protein
MPALFNMKFKTRVEPWPYIGSGNGITSEAEQAIERGENAAIPLYL